MSSSILLIIVINLLLIPRTEFMKTVSKHISELRIDVPLEHFSAISKQCSSRRQSKVCSTSVPLSQFLPYGLAAGDELLPPGDDQSSPPIQLLITFPFMNHHERVLFVNINGLLSFNQPIAEFKPKCQQLPLSQRMVAPFWTDVITDTGLGGEIFFRQSTEPELLRKVRTLISTAFNSPITTSLYYNQKIQSGRKILQNSLTLFIYQPY